MALTFTSIVPSDGAKLALRGAMTFTLSTDLPSAEGVMVSVYCSALDTEEMAWDGAQFVGRYVTASTKVGDDFILYRRGGWPTGGVSLRVRELGALSFMSVFTDGAGAPSDAVGVDGDYYINTTNGSIYKKAAGTYSVISTQLTALTGDVTASGAGSQAATIASGAVTLAKMANLATDRLIGRSTAGTGVPEAITCTAAGRALLDDATAADQRTTLELGSLATLSSIDDGSVTYAKTGNLISVQASDSPKLDSASAQNIFAAAQDTFTVTAQTYLITGSLRFTWDGIPTSTDIDLLFGGTATVSYCIWDSIATGATTAAPAVATTTPQSGRSAGASNTVFRAAGSDRYRFGFLRGAVSFSVGGTFIPQFQLSLTTGQTLSIKQGSFIEMRPVGTGIQGVS